MKSTRAALELLAQYEVTHVFGLPGETTLPLYNEWGRFSEVRHVMCRDERNTVMMADGFARTSFRPGVCEAPGVGASYLLPGLAEASASSVPLIALTSDIALGYEKANVLTGYEKTLMFRGVTKESLTVYRPEDLPVTLRRAFRVATTGRPGPVHVRIPMNVWDGEVADGEVYAQPEFSRYPGLRYAADDGKVRDALVWLMKAERPLLICGQGVLFSQAWDEVRELAQRLVVPVGTTISGKGSFTEDHPLSIGVVGSRGGTRFSQSVLEASDLVFYIGSNTDSVDTEEWTLPPKSAPPRILHLDISEGELGNVYRADLLLGDAKLTLQRMLALVPEAELREPSSASRISELARRRKEYRDHVDSLIDAGAEPLDPLHLMKTLSETVPADWVVAADPAFPAIYSAAFFPVKRAGRRFLYNYSVGALGFAIPAAVGAYFAKGGPGLALTTDGSFGFTVGELETIRRTDAEVKIVLFNNGSFGWIRATVAALYGEEPFSTDFAPTDYAKVAEGFGIPATVPTSGGVKEALEEMFARAGPQFMEIPVLPEDRLFPPVPSWRAAAEKLGVKYAG